MDATAKGVDIRWGIHICSDMGFVSARRWVQYAFLDVTVFLITSVIDLPTGRGERREREKGAGRCDRRQQARIGDS
jgi:hypothetical protein